VFFRASMAADPIALQAGQWLGVAGAGLALLTVAAFVAGWGVRFRLVGVTSFTVLLALSCLAFAVSYTPRVQVEGAVTVPIVYDNGADLVVAAAPPDLDSAGVGPTVEQLALNVRGRGRTSPDGQVRVRLRRLEPAPAGASRPVILGEVRLDLASGELQSGA
jgi:hypothetical protein